MIYKLSKVFNILLEFIYFHIKNDFSFDVLIEFQFAVFK